MRSQSNILRKSAMGLLSPCEAEGEVLFLRKKGVQTNHVSARKERVMKTRSLRWQGVVLACGMFLLAVWLSSPLWAQPSNRPSGMILGEYGSATNLSEWEGTLYCLRHDFSQDKKDHEICQKEGRHRHVLLMKDGHVHPLYGNNDELNNLINSSEMNAKKVRIAGKYYVTTNAILVSNLKVLE